MVFQERTYSVLIVTASERFTDSIMPLLPMTDYWPVQTASRKYRSCEITIRAPLYSFR